MLHTFRGITTLSEADFITIIEILREEQKIFSFSYTKKGKKIETTLTLYSGYDISEVAPDLELQNITSVEIPA